MNKRYENDPDVSAEKRELPSLSDGPPSIETKYTRGVIGFSSLFHPLNSEEMEELEHRQPKQLGFDYSSFWELSAWQGECLMFSVISDAGSDKTSGNYTDRVLADIKEETSDGEFDFIMRNYNRLADKEEVYGHGAVFLLAVWADLFAEPFGEFWLAAMAQHAYYIEEKDYAFGYLIAVLDQKRQNEQHFLRGANSVANARKGGRKRSRAQRPRIDAILKQMGDLRDTGHSVSNAARLVAKRGFGSSPEANRRLWSRHHKK